MTTQNPLGPIEIVAAYADTRDPAIDAKASDLETYIKTRNPKTLVFHAGMQPTKFVLQPLEATYLAEKLDNLQDFQKLMHAFLAACHEIVLPDGTVMKAPVLNDDPIHGIKLATRAWVNQVAARFRLATVYEVGFIAIKRAQLRPDELGPFTW